MDDYQYPSRNNNAGLAGSLTPTQASPLDEEFAKQNRALVGMNAEVERLAARLSPLLVPRAEKSGSAESRPEPMRSVALAQLASNTRGILAVTQRLSEITESLDV